MLTGEPGRPLEGTPVNGAQALIRTLTGCGVDTCFSNPGTSEMHFVAALDAVPEMRGVLCLFEGVATGAADGYGRMPGPARRRPAAPRAGPGQRAGQPAQRPARAHPGAGHRRRPRHLPQPAGRAAGVRHRVAGPAGVRLVPPDRRRRRWPPGRRRRGGRGPPLRRAGWPPWSCPPTCPGPTAASPPRPG